MKAASDAWFSAVPVVQSAGIGLEIGVVGLCLALSSNMQGLVLSFKSILSLPQARAVSLHWAAWIWEV